MYKSILVIIAIITFSCNTVKEKTKEAVNKTGETVGKVGSEFAEGVAKGVEKTFTNRVEISENLKAAGLKTGKILILNSSVGTDNLVSAYLMFDSDFDKKIIIKVFDETGLEYGRVTQSVKAFKGEAKYFDFVFDKRTNIDSKGKITFE